jgi:hypothetical protein
MPADKVEELHVRYSRLSKLDDLEDLYHEAEYSLSLLLMLHDILKEKRITKDKDISELIGWRKYLLGDSGYDERLVCDYCYYTNPEYATVCPRRDREGYFKKKRRADAANKRRGKI